MLLGKVLPYGAYRLDAAPVIPAFYWDVYSAEQRYKHMCAELHKLANYANMLGADLNLTHEAIDDLQRQLDELNAGGWIDTYISQLIDWINAHLDELIAKRIKMVFFGLTDDGYFCAYIPESWSDIRFDTGMVWGRFDYGRLILRYDVDGSGVIDNTGRYDGASTEGILARLADLERRVNRNDGTLYTQLAQGGE